MKYKVYGDYGYESETLLEEFDSKAEAIRWAEGYTESDTGGFMMVEVAYFADEEYVTVWTITAEDDDGQPTEQEEWLDFDPDC